MLVPADSDSSTRAFLYGARLAFTTAFFAVMVAGYLGLGALAHAMGFSVSWLTVTTLIVWAGPPQVIMMTLLAAGGGLVETAIAVTLSGVRLFPMVVALLPLVRGPRRTIGRLVLPAHFTSVTMWVQCLMTLPSVPPKHRVAFCNGLSVTYVVVAMISGAVGFYSAATLPLLLAAMLIFITPLSFLVSTLGSSKTATEKIAFALGLVVAVVLDHYKVEFDLLWCGAIAGGAAYAIHRWRGKTKESGV